MLLGQRVSLHYSDPKPKINEDWLCAKVPYGVMGSYGVLRGGRGISMGRLWGIYGVAMGRLWGICGVAMGGYGGSMGWLWGIYGAVPP